MDNGTLIELTSNGENVKFKSQIGNLILCLEVLRDESRAVERKVEENGYPPPCLDVFKIK